MTSQLEEWPTKAKETHSPHEVRLTLLYTNPVFQYLRERTSSALISIYIQKERVKCQSVQTILKIKEY